MAMKYPIGIQNFGEVRRGGYVYVDKAGDCRQLFKIGVSFSSETRRVNEWKIA